jgi:hypothetical protein
MSQPGSALHILVPGLLGPMPGLDGMTGLPDLSGLERRLSRAHCESVAGRDFESTLFSLFGSPHSSGQDYPAAACRRIGDGAVADNHVWAELTPVFLRPDQDRLLLFDMEDLGLELEQSRALANLLRQHFSEEGWMLDVPATHRWYLRLDQVPRLQTRPLGDVLGRSISRFLPSGEDALRWHAILNEIQMLFTTCEINQAREACGKLPVNGVWVSGIGTLEGGENPGFSLVASDDVLLKGLATLHRVPQQDCLPESPQAGSLLLYDGLKRAVWQADPFAWLAGLSAFQVQLEQWARQLGKGGVERLLLYPCNGTRFELSRGNQRRFWRRRRSHVSRLDTD